jgi:hypothetical protein
MLCRQVAQSRHVMRLGEWNARHDEHALHDLLRCLLTVVGRNAEHRPTRIEA